MKTILVPTDFSETAANAIEHAAHLCHATHRNLLILHVQSDESDVNAEEKLEATRAALVSAFPYLDCRTLALPGEDLTDKIVETATRLAVDLIVMGTEGQSNFEKLIFGSKTSSVIERSPCKVLSIPFTSPFKQPRNILFATNFEHQDLHAAVDVVTLAKAFHATVIIGHVFTDPDREEIERSKLEIFCRDLMLITDYGKITYRLSSDNTVTMGLDSLIDGIRPEVMALSTHRRSLLEKILNPSITQKFAGSSEIPLLALHAEV
jgi:nucleotide-binding universal stress UspA family protein